MEFIPHISSVFLSTLVTSQLVKKHPNEIKSNLSVDGGLFHWLALLTFYTMQHQKLSFIEWINTLIFKLVHFMQYKPRKYFKNGYFTKNFQTTVVKFSLIISKIGQWRLLFQIIFSLWPIQKIIWHWFWFKWQYNKKAGWHSGQHFWLKQ